MQHRNLALSMGLVVVLALGACGKDDASDADAGPNDDMSPATTDAGSVDDANASTDSGSSAPDDGSGTPDTGGVMDAGAAPDTGSTPDMSAEDVGSPADLGTDAGADASTSGACAPGLAEHVGIADVIVACEGAGGAAWDQCMAEDVCGTGWHMCTATEYRAAYEAMEPPAVAMANFWIASCVRDGADPTAPSDQVCSDCTGTMTGGSVDVSYSCVNALTIETEQLYVGVRAGSACTFAGLDAAGNDAYWNAQPAATKQAGAFCCAD